MKKFIDWLDQMSDDEPIYRPEYLKLSYDC